MVKQTFEQFANSCNIIASGLEPTAIKVFDFLADFALHEIQADAPVDTGYMKDNVRKDKPNPSTVRVFSGATYSIFVDQGHNTVAGTFVEANPFFTKTKDRVQKDMLVPRMKDEVSKLIRTAIR